MHFKTFKAHASRHVLAVLAVGTLLPFPVMAQQAAVFSPASSWSVGSTELSNVRGLSSMKLPCVITTEFDNGFVVRFSGGGGKIMAMAVDFRQDAFKQGKKYDAMISVGDTYMKQVAATAFTSNTLIFNLRPLPDFYNAVKGGKTLEIDIDGNVMKFALGQLGAAFPAMESCYTGEKVAEAKPMLENTQQADAGHDLPRSPSAPVAKVEEVEMDVPPAAPAPLLPADIAAKPLPQSMDDIVKGAEAEKTAAAQLAPAPVKAPPQAQAPAQQLAPPAQPQMRVSQVTPKPTEKPAAVTPVTPAAPVQDIPPASSAAPQKISRVMDTGPSAPPQTVAAAPLAPLPPAQQPSVAPVEKAPVAAPVQQNAVTTAPAPASAAEPSPAPPAAQTAAAKPLQLAPATPPAPKTWDAKAGEDLKIVLSRWAERAGYDLQWQADQDGKVAQDIALSGSFEDAVSQLLAENSAATGIAGHVQSDQGKKDLARKSSVKDPAPQPPATKAIIPALHTDWNAPAGANIQTVLDQWGTKAGVTVVWQSYMSIPLKAPVDVTGSFEEAVQTLLDQYQGDSARPVAQLNIDPETGQRTLLLDMDDPR